MYRCLLILGILAITRIINGTYSLYGYHERKRTDGRAALLRAKKPDLVGCGGGYDGGGGWWLWWGHGPSC